MYKRQPLLLAQQRVDHDVAHQVDAVGAHALAAAEALDLGGGGVLGRHEGLDLVGFGAGLTGLPPVGLLLVGLFAHVAGEQRHIGVGGLGAGVVLVEVLRDLQCVEQHSLGVVQLHGQPSDVLLVIERSLGIVAVIDVVEDFGVHDLAVDDFDCVVGILGLGRGLPLLVGGGPLLAVGSKRETRNPVSGLGPEAQNSVRPATMGHAKRPRLQDEGGAVSIIPEGSGRGLRLGNLFLDLQRVGRKLVVLGLGQIGVEATTMVGSTVTYSTGSAGGTASGVVSGVQLLASGPVLVVGGTSVPLSSITSVSAVSVSPG